MRSGPNLKSARESFLSGREILLLNSSLHRHDDRPDCHHHDHCRLEWFHPKQWKQVPQEGISSHQFPPEIHTWGRHVRGENFTELRTATLTAGEYFVNRRTQAAGHHHSRAESRCSNIIN